MAFQRGGTVAATVDLSSVALRQHSATVEELQDSQAWPNGTTSGAAESIVLPASLFPRTLAAVSIVNTGTAVASTSSNFWTVGLVKVVPQGPAGTAPKLVRLAEKTTVAITDPSAAVPGNPGERVYDSVYWSFDPIGFYAVDPDDPTNQIAPTTFQVGDHLRVTFTPTGSTPGDWGPRAIATRWEPTELTA